MSYDKKLMKTFHGKPCVCCGSTKGTVGHHVRSIGAGGDNSPENLMVLCGYHHSMVHSMGLNWLAERESVKSWLILNGWVFNNFLNKWVREYPEDL